MNTPSRRTLLANVPAIAMAALAGGAVTKALSAEPDPVFAAIEAHKAAMAAHTAAFNTEDEVLAAFEAVNSDYQRHSRAARAIAEEYFRAETVLAKLLGDLGY